MNIIYPKVELITESNPLKRIELCGRVSYKSEGKITETSAGPFVERLFKNGHTSVLEHARILVPIDDPIGWEAARKTVINTPYGFWDRLEENKEDETFTMSVCDYLAMGGSIKNILDNVYPNAKGYMSAMFTTDIGSGRELIRSRTNSFTQESTRYVDYRDEITCVLPYRFIGDPDFNCEGSEFEKWVTAMKRAEYYYIQARESGISPQEARDFLPLATKTDLIITAMDKWWKRLIEQRSAADAHPQVQYLMGLLKSETEGLK